MQQEIAASAMTSKVFAFCNKNKDKLKVWYLDKTGFALWHKRLEKDKLKWPDKEADDVVTLTAEQWQWLLSGLSVIAHKPLNYGYNSGF
ncbi:IS66 family insertion sequence element accessory protein TnpB [Pseudoalteromonas holothuriae]|nr:IS66 family insertion sequence element accessory protein TnpB [Pseudoalteromonas sp. CIP111854]